MDEQIREVFGQLHAGEAMKENTKAALDRARNRRRRPVGYLAVAAACLVFGGVLYLAALQAQGVDLRKIFRLRRAQAG